MPGTFPDENQGKYMGSERQERHSDGHITPSQNSHSFPTEQHSIFTARTFFLDMPLSLTVPKHRLPTVTATVTSLFNFPECHR